MSSYISLNSLRVERCCFVCLHSRFLWRRLILTPKQERKWLPYDWLEKALFPWIALFLLDAGGEEIMSLQHLLLVPNTAYGLCMTSISGLTTGSSDDEVSHSCSSKLHLLSSSIQVTRACAHPGWNWPSLMDEKKMETAFMALLSPEDHQEV